ncbi:branched-chain-amino-acid aminotransferase, mitochondrial [Trichomonascus vanleenenianus]|uniref:branched-chain-amino-acid transaminase BAT1 n=1 Tax=Trichomonascus vanleenenianus TaxID=2268995 RepID=UPI003EC98EF1
MQSLSKRLPALLRAQGLQKRSLSTTSALFGAKLDASKVTVSTIESRKDYPSPEKLAFGKTFSDHMLLAEWTEKDGWKAPQIVPYGPLSLDPSASVFHYAFECFEGMKAFKTEDGSVRLFRPDMNGKRLNKSSARLALPTFDVEEFTKLIQKFVSLEKEVIPHRKGYSLYLRPTMIGTNAELGVKHPSKALLYVIASPVGPYYAGGFKAVRLQASTEAVRAWPGGVGDKKLGGNYAPTILPQIEAAKQGYDQVLWLFGPENYVTEAGTMNAFFVFKKDGKKELVTAPLDGTILEGVTRDSILALARERLNPDEWIVSERLYTMDEVAERAAKGEVVEAFGAGTAAIVSPIKEIGYKGKDIAIPLQADKGAGELTETVAKWISDIQYGVEKHPWSVEV